MIDRYGRDIYYLRLSVTELCNLRCRYCMPAEGVCKLRHDEMLTEDEIIRAVEKAGYTAKAQNSAQSKPKINIVKLPMFRMPKSKQC